MRSESRPARSLFCDNPWPLKIVGADDSFYRAVAEFNCLHELPVGAEKEYENHETSTDRPTSKVAAYERL